MKQPVEQTARCEEIALRGSSPLTRRHLQVLRFGNPKARPKAYLQASLHADETPALLVLNHLAERLRQAAAAGEVIGQVVLVPIANPIGLAQTVNGALLGRFALNGTGNFNRHYPDLAADAATLLEGRLGSDADANIAAVRAALATALADLPCPDEVMALRHTLLALALDADIALDLHCDEEALLHLYLGGPLWPAARDLAAWCVSHATLLADVSGGNPFDEAVGGAWWSLAERFPAAALPPACLSATVELRGDRDVDEETAAADAEHLFRFLQGRGVIAGEPGQPPPLNREATPLAAVEFLRAPHAGIVCWRGDVGEDVRKGELLGWLIDPAEREFDAARWPLLAGADGLVFARRAQRMAAAGDVLAKIAGETVLAERARGPLLTS